MVVGQKGRSQGREIGERSRASGDGRDDHIDGGHSDDDNHRRNHDMTILMATILMIIHDPRDL